MSSSNRVDTFMDSCLVAWVKTFDEPVTSIKDLASGVIFNKIMNTIDPNLYGMSRVNHRVGEDIQLRLQNLHLASNYILHFYYTVLKQLIITALPDVVAIAHNPSSDKALEELEKMIVLLLGCAVQCENKATLIQKMMAMEQQRGLVPYIQQMTDTTEFVCALDWTDLEQYPKADLEVLCRSAYVHLQRVAKERNGLFDVIVETTQEVDFYRAHQAAGTPAKSPFSPEVNKELIEAKKQSRLLRDQLDRTLEKVSLLQEELNHSRSDLQQAQNEHQSLLEEAKTMRIYRDEVEVLQSKTAKMEQLEVDVTRLRQKAEDTDYLKKRVQELKQEMQLMTDTKILLEQKATTLASKAEVTEELQSELASLKVRLDAVNQEKEMDSKRMEELVGDNARLELENKSNQEQINQLVADLQIERDRMAAVAASSSSAKQSNLSAEVTEVELAQRAKLLRLERDNREMERSMEAVRHSQAKVSELERTNKKLYSQTHTDKKAIIKLKEEVEMLKVKASRVDKLQAELGSNRDKLEEATRLQMRLRETKRKCDQALEARATLEDEVENLQDKVALLAETKSENAQLKAQVDSLTEEHTEDEKRLQELMEQNAQLELEKQTLSERVTTLTNEAGRTSKSTPSPAKFITSPPRMDNIDLAQKARLQRLEKETREMEKTVESLRHSQAKVAELEKTSKKLQKQTHADRKEIARLKEELLSFKSKTSRLEKQKMVMQTPIEEAEAADRKIMELKQQNILLSETKALLEEEVGSLHQKLDALGELQADNAALKVRVGSLEQEMEDENERMQSLLQENAQLEVEKDKDTAKIESLQTEVERLRRSALKSSNPEDSSSRSSVMSESEMEMRAKMLHLERDHRDLQRTFDLYKQRTERASKELEKTNQKMNTQNHNDRKEIVRLKEELKRKKADLTKLSTQLEEYQKSGVTSVPGTPTDKDKDFQDLESRYGEQYSKSLATKEERIATLERRLEEAMGENQTLRDEIASARKMVRSSSAGGPGGSPLARSLNARELSRMREQADESGRMKEKNAHLMADLADCRNVIHQHQHTISTQKQNVEMLELLNHTLEEEKKTLLMQVNKLLEQNQSLLMRSIESKDSALEDERMFSDRLGELQRDKERLSDQLISQQREAMNREIQLMRKREKSKSLIKRGLKKLRGKFQSDRTWHFQHDDGLLQPGAAPPPVSSSPHHSTLTPNFLHNDGSCSSSQSISSAEHTDSREDLDIEGHSFVPRGPTVDHNSPVTLRQKRQLKTQSMYLPTKDSASPRYGADQTEDIVSLLDFLDETNKRPNNRQRKHMEIKRASMISTPPMTPRSSVFLTLPSHNGSGDQVELQKFLQEYQGPDDTMSIPEVEETESDQHQKEDCKTPVHSSGTATPDETPSLLLNTNNNSNSPSLTRSSLAVTDSPSSSLVTGSPSSLVTASPSSLVAGRSSTGGDSPRSLDRLSTGSASPSSALNRWVVPAGGSLDSEEGVITSSNGIPKSKSADDVLDEKRTPPELVTKQARKSLFTSSSSNSTGGGKWRTRAAHHKAKKPSFDDIDVSQQSRGRAMSLFTFPPPKPAKKSSGRKFSLKWRRGSQQPAAENRPLPTLQEVPVHLSQDMQAYAFDTLSQPQPIDPDSLTCPSYGFVQ